MTHKLKWREFRRYNSSKLLEILGNGTAIVYVDGQPMFKVKVVTEKDIEQLDTQATRHEYVDTQANVNPSMSHPDVPEPSIIAPIPWYDRDKHTTGDRVRMRRGNNIEVVTL